MIDNSQSQIFLESKYRLTLVFCLLKCYKVTHHMTTWIHATHFRFRLGRRKPLCFYSVIGGVTCILAGALSKDTGINNYRWYTRLPKQQRSPHSLEVRTQFPEKRGLTRRIRFSQRCWIGAEITTPTPKHLVILNPASRFPKRFHNCISSLRKNLHFWEFCHHISVHVRVVSNSYQVKLSSFMRRSKG